MHLPFTRGHQLSPLPLDGMTTPAFAISTRRLRNAYQGACCRIRRSSDNAEVDIGFLGNDINSDAIRSFIGSDSAYVVTWYDQSGDGRNATQATTTLQSRIANAGAIETINGRVAANSVDKDEQYSFTAITLPSAASDFGACCIVQEDGLGGTGRHMFGGGADDCTSLRISATTGILELIRQNVLSIYASALVPPTQLNIVSLNTTTSFSQIGLNGTKTNNTTSVVPTQGVSKLFGGGYLGNTEIWRAKYCEIILLDAYDPVNVRNLEISAAKYFNIAIT